MFAYIKGIVAEIQENTVVIEAGGIGHELLCTTSAIFNMEIGKVTKIYTVFSVKDDGVSIFGFYDKTEKDIFNRLITVSGVGPKMALNILSSINYNHLTVCILSGDVASLSSVKGIGKKTAERIVLELKESLPTLSVSFNEQGSATKASSEDSAVADSIEALTSLGMSRSDVYTLVLDARKKTADAGEIIRIVLRQFGR